MTEAPTAAQRSAVETAAQAVLDACADFPASTLADLYDPLAMPRRTVPWTAATAANPSPATATASNTSSPSTKNSPPPSPRRQSRGANAQRDSARLPDAV